MHEYLIARHADSGEVVGTCSILGPEAAQLVGGYDLERHFDLGWLEVLRGRMVEMSRVCLHPDYGPDGVMRLIGSALARYLIDKRLDYVLACASVGVEDGGHAAASIYHAACARSMSPEDYRVSAARAAARESAPHPSRRHAAPPAGLPRPRRLAVRRTRVVSPREARASADPPAPRPPPPALPAPLPR